MNKKSLLLAAAVLVVASVPLFTSWMPLTAFSTYPVKIYSGNQSFLHRTGQASPYGWEAFYRAHHPGYLVKGLQNGGDSLARGTYRYDFFFASRAGHLTGLLSDANDVVRLEVVDTVTHEILGERTLQRADFRGPRHKLLRKSILFSTWGRAGHTFEPRIYWQGLSGIFLARVELAALGDPSLTAIGQKAADFESMMPALFIDRGFVIVRDSDDQPADIGDAAIWTGLYAASEALRYRSTQSADARRRMEQALWALHSLVKASPLPGTMVRYLDENGQALPEPASKDTYTGFFYAAAQAMPFVHSPSLKRALLSDMESLGNHFLAHDLSFVSPYGNSLDLNPYPGPAFMKEAFLDLRKNTKLRNDVAKTLRLARWYFWSRGQKPPSSFGRLERELRRPDSPALEKELLPFLNDLHTALKKLQQNVHRSALRGASDHLTETPYSKLDLLLLRTLHNLDDATGNRPLSSIEDLKILPSQSLHALHFLKVAGDLLPKPNRFESYYYANLYEGKALLRTAIQWHEIDEEALTAVLGQTETDTRRTASSHLSYLALHDLILLEKDPAVRFQYQKLFEAQYEPMRTDGNAMIDAMHAAVGLSTKQLGLALWSLERYPADRRGKGEAYWAENRKALLAAFGGSVNGQARDPLPPDLRPRDAFLWQRSARSLRGDQKDWLYPPLDYLFAYWLARTVGLQNVGEEYSRLRESLGSGPDRGQLTHRAEPGAV